MILRRMAPVRSRSPALRMICQPQGNTVRCRGSVGSASAETARGRIHHSSWGGMMRGISVRDGQGNSPAERGIPPSHNVLGSPRLTGGIRSVPSLGCRLGNPSRGFWGRLGTGPRVIAPRWGGEAAKIALAAFSLHPVPAGDASAPSRAVNGTRCANGTGPEDPASPSALAPTPRYRTASSASIRRTDSLVTDTLAPMKFPVRTSAAALLGHSRLAQPAYDPETPATPVRSNTHFPRRTSI